jgi:hypothetical protein
MWGLKGGYKNLFFIRQYKEFKCKINNGNIKNSKARLTIEI